MSTSEPTPQDVNTLHQRLAHLESLLGTDVKSFEAELAKHGPRGALDKWRHKVWADMTNIGTAEAAYKHAEQYVATHDSVQLQALKWESALADQGFSAPDDRNPILQQWEQQEGVGAQPGAPWCQYFQNIAWVKATGHKLPAGFLAGEPGYTPWVLDAARKGEFGLKVVQPQRFAWMYFDWNGDGVPDHVGMVVDPSTKETVEGNTSSSAGTHTVAFHHSEHWDLHIACVWPWDMQ